jgi:signal transduction histidine kinase
LNVAPRPLGLFSTTTFRLALLYAGLFCTSVLALFAFLFWTTTVLVDRQREQAIVSDMTALTDEFREHGLGGLSDAIDSRTEPDRVGNNLYLLTDHALQPVTGNVSNWPRTVHRQGRFLTFPILLEGESVPHQAQVLHVSLPGDYHLLVGQDTRAEQQFRDTIVQALGWSVAITLVLGLGGGFVMSRHMLRRLEAINQATERIMRGEVGHRMPVRSGHDEFDRLALNLNLMLEEIERLMGSMRTVTHNIAHDLRSPLTHMRNRLELALATGGDPHRQREAIEQASADADQMLATFNALLSIADTEAGAGRSDMEPVDLSAVARDVAELYEPVVEERGMTLRLAAYDPQVVSGNRHLLFQALTNLVDNAVKHARGGHRVEIAVGLDQGAPSVTVADDGPGIPEADRGRVLDRFVRLDASRTTPGNGLGLSLVAAVARLHGAALSLGDNTPGLRVTLRFDPARQQLALPPPRAAA